MSYNTGTKAIGTQYQEKLLKKGRNFALMIFFGIRNYSVVK